MQVDVQIYILVLSWLNCCMSLGSNNIMIISKLPKIEQNWTSKPVGGVRHPFNKQIKQNHEQKGYKCELSVAEQINGHCPSKKNNSNISAGAFKTHVLLWKPSGGHNNYNPILLDFENMWINSIIHVFLLSSWLEKHVYVVPHHLLKFG